MLFIRRYRKNSLSDLWLGILLLVMCSSLIIHFIGFANVYDNNQWLTFFPFEITFAHAPVIYLYVQHLTNDNRRFCAKDLLFFIPAFICWTYFFILFWQNLEFKDWFDDVIQSVYVVPFLNVALFLWNIGFMYLSIKYYRRYRVWLNENFSDISLIKFNWLRNFLYIFAFLFLLEAAFDLIGLFTKLSYIQFFYFKFVLAIATYYLAIAGYVRSRAIEINFSPVDELQTEEPKNFLKVNELESTKTKLIKLMKTEKPHLDSQLTLKELSKKLGVNTTVLSYTINKGFDKNFNDFINEFRIEEVKKALRSEKNGDETLLNIAFDSGFNSKATFNRAFKKVTGVSPKEFSQTVGN